MLYRMNSISTAAVAMRAKQARRLLTILLLIGFINPGPASPVLAQQAVSIKQIKEQIAVMEETDRKAEMSPDVRRLNAEFLRGRRAQLQALLTTRVNALRNYYFTIGKSLSAEEKQAVEKSIRDLEEELQQLELTKQANLAGEDAKVTQPSLTSDGQTRLATAISPSSSSGDSGNILYSSTSNNNENEQTNVASNALLQSECYPNAPPALIQEVRAAAQQIVDRRDPAEITSQFFQILFFVTAHAVSVDAVDVDQERRDLINRIEIKRLQEQTKRTDKQIGASARAEGSTTAAEKPGFAELLGFAIENGAVQKEVSGTTLSLSSSPYAFIVAAQGDTATAYKNYGYLSRVGISANFNIGNQDNVLANVRRKQLAEWSVRARLTPDRSARSREAEEIWNSISDQFAQPDLVLTGELATEFRSDAALAAKRREIEDRFLSPAFTVPANAVIQDTALTREQKIERIAKLILCQVKTDIFDQVRSGAFNMSAGTRDRLINRTLPRFEAALRAKEAAIKAFGDGLDRLSYKPVLTFAYTNKRDPASSDYSIFKLLYQKKSYEGMNIIANAGLSFYHKPNAVMNQQSVRDFAAAFSFEGNAGRSPFLSSDLDESRITFSLTGRYQRLLENRGVANKKADIAIAQFKLEFPLLTGFSLPFSVTYANATELIKEDHVRANFGFTIDTDKIFQVLKLNKLQKK